MQVSEKNHTTAPPVISWEKQLRLNRTDDDLQNMYNKVVLVNASIILIRNRLK